MILILLLIAGIFTYVTKPSDDSFSTYLQNAHTNDPRMKKFDLITSTAIYLLGTDITDYGLVKIAHIKPNKQDLYFIGAFQNWYLLDDKKHK